MSFVLNSDPRVINIKAVRGIFEASIPIANNAGVSGVHYNITFTQQFAFNLFAFPTLAAGQGEFGSVIHGNVSSAAPFQGTINGLQVGSHPYFNSKASSVTDVLNNENIQTVTTDVNDPIPCPMYGCTKLNFSLNVQSTTNSDLFCMQLYRMCSTQDLGNKPGMLAAQWGPVVSGLQLGVNPDTAPTFATSQPYDIPIGFGWCLYIMNITSNSRVNSLLGSVFVTG